LPYQPGERFVVLLGGTLKDPDSRSAHTVPDLLKYQQETRSFDVFGWFKLGNFNLTSPGEPQHLNGAKVTLSLVQNLGVHLTAGRWFEDEAGAVISTALWKRLADPGLVGKTITLNGRIYTITGIAPPGFQLPVAGIYSVGQNDVWIALDPLGREESPDQGAFFCYARLKPGVGLVAAQADVKRVAADIAKEKPASHDASYTARLDSLRDTVVSGIRPTLMLLFASAGLLLLITCANLAGLLLARSIARARETSIRVAIGATQRHLAMQYFAEALFVSLAGGAAGMLVSATLVRIVVSMAADAIPRAEEIGVDWTVFLFSFGAAYLTTALASLAPVLQSVHTPPTDVLSDGARVSAGARSRRMSRLLVISELSVAFSMLAISAVLILHLRNLNRTQPGFDPDHLLTFQITLPDAIVASDPQRISLQNRLPQELEAIPGVTGAAFANHLPLAGCCFETKIYPEDRPADVAAPQRMSFVPVSPGYFQAMRIPVRMGRVLTYQDTKEDLLRVVINQAAARFYWPGRDAVGAYGHFGTPQGSRFQVVGIVGDVRNNGLANPSVPEIYLSGSVVAWNPLEFVVRSERPLQSLLSDVRRAIQRIDPGLPIHSVTTMNEIAAQSVTFERVGSFMTAFFCHRCVIDGNPGYL
jgi:putative ABC transport system permease protein